MKKNLTVIISLICFCGCLTLGFYYMFQHSDETSGQPPKNSTAPFTIERRSILFIQVDRLPAQPHPPAASPFQTTPQVEATSEVNLPHLETISLVLFSPQNPGITVVLLYPPENGVETEIAKKIVGSFSLAPDGSLSPAFSDILKENKIHSNGYIIIDNEGIRQWINLFNGLPLENGEILNGDRFMSEYAKINTNPGAVSQWHQIISSGLCTRLPGLDQDEIWSKLMFSLFPAHLHTNISLETYVADMQALDSFSSSITCDVSYP